MEKFFSEEKWGKVIQSNKDLLNDFLLDLKQKKRSPKTIYQYKSDLQGYMCYLTQNLENQDILKLSRKDFRKFSIYLVDERKVSSARHNRIIAVLHSFLNFAEENDEVEYTNQSRRVRGIPNEPVKEIAFLSDELILSLYDKYMLEQEYQKATLLILAYDSAARREELLQVTKGSFYFERNDTNIVVGKGRKKFSLLYFYKTTFAARSWLEIRGIDSVDSLWLCDGKQPNADWIYKTFIDMRKDIETLKGPSKNFSPHSMRHSALTNYGNGTHYICKGLRIEGGFPLEKLKLIAHHDSMDTTQGYLPDNSVSELKVMFRLNVK